jgi:2-polyprenyl-6-methoxyphenol hydroxylase-like FAD-dependent oxidoreductase
MDRPESASVIYDRLVQATFPATRPVLFDTACVLGGSVAGSLAAAVLARFSRRVVVIERDETGAGGHPGVPHDQQLHVLLPSGRALIDRLLPGFTETVLAAGAALVAPRQNVSYQDNRQFPMVDDGYPMLTATRPLLESSIRALTLAGASVEMVRGRVAGLRYADDGVTAVRYVDDEGEHTIAADFAVDAMGASSRLSAWLGEDGYERPAASRVPCGVNYATAYFERTEPVHDLPIAASQSSYTSGKTAVAAVIAIEDDQWSLVVSTYDGRLPESAGEFRAACATLPPEYGAVASAAITRDILTFRKAHNVRRDFAGRRRFPARLAAIGDAAASFNPIYGQGIASATLQAAALSDYLTENPDLTLPATSFFERQNVVVEAAWATSAGGDAALADAISGAEVPESLRHQRWAAGQIARASLRDETIRRACLATGRMLAHPETLFDHAVLDRAVEINAAG